MPPLAPFPAPIHLSIIHFAYMLFILLSISLPFALLLLLLLFISRDFI